jgi:nucleoporin NUP42
MQDDLTTERPLFYLSVYSPHKSAINMIDGTDVSPEELRFQAYQARANNTTSQYVSFTFSGPGRAKIFDY